MLIYSRPKRFFFEREVKAVRKRFIAVYFVTLFFLNLLCPMAAGFGETLRPGMSGDEVRTLQQALIDQRYLSGSADGVYGRNTEAAVRAFQKKNGLHADGLAGAKTQEALYRGGAKGKEGSSSKEGKGSSGYFSGDYTTIRSDSDPSRIVLLQKALISMEYLDASADGKFGTQTTKALVIFQKQNGLKCDGLAGKKTLTALEKAMASGQKAEKKAEPAESGSGAAERISPPDKDSIVLLHWFKDIKPKLGFNRTLTVYDPATKLSWNLVVETKTRRCDCEPKTLQDTETMLKAFGGKTTWCQKGVYVKLPDGRWTVAATCSMPQRTGKIKDNGFDGKLCVHFFRDLDECLKTDPDYGLSNQRTIRSLWRKVSGEIVD